MKNSFLDKKEYTLEDLENLIKLKIEESINIDYKSAPSIGKSDKKKKEISKDVSAFANSNGGIIIYGVDEEDHIPTRFSYIDGNDYSKEWLENIIDGNIQPRILGIEIFPIRKNEQIKNTIYIVKIPESINSPHICSDKRYYRRFNFKSVPMEEYEIRNLYTRNSKTDVYIDSIISKRVKNSDKDYIEKEIFVLLENKGSSIEKHCKVEVFFKNIRKYDIKYSYDKEKNIRQKLTEDGIVFLTAHNESPIFPNERHSIINFQLIIKKEHIENIISNSYLVVNLYDSFSKKSSDYTLHEILKIND